MTKFYKYGFWFLLLFIFSLINFIRINRSVGKDVSQVVKDEKNIKRINSLLKTNSFNLRQTPLGYGEEIISKYKESNLFTEKAIVILLSEFKCDRCQEKELLRINKLKEDLKEEEIKIIGITTLEKKNEVAIQKRVLNLNFPIFWVEDTLFNQLSFIKEYPQIIYIKNNIILSGFLPIPMDGEFSEMFYNELKKVISIKNNYR